MTIVPEIRTALEAAITALDAIEGDVEVGGMTVTALEVDVVVGAAIFAEDTLKPFTFEAVRNELLHILAPTDMLIGPHIKRGYALADLVTAIA